MNAMVTSVLGVLVEAWQEIRVHRARVLLSLLGVAIAVCALSASVAAASLAQQAIAEQNEVSGGRDATLSINAYPSDASPAALDAIDEAWAKSVERHRMDFVSNVTNTGLSVRFPSGAVETNVTIVNPSYLEMHRVRLTDGTWFAADDDERLVPAVVVDEHFYEALGSPPLDSHPVTSIDGDPAHRVVVIGTFTPPYDMGMPAAYILPDGAERVLPHDALAASGRTFEAWVPPADIDVLMGQLEAEMRASLGSSVSVDVSRTDAAAYTNGEDPLLPLRMLTNAVAVVILVLGALSLLNISVVTMRQRIREVGIRRSFGASSARVFSAVLLESVLGTLVAGFAGVTAAVLILSMPSVRELFAAGGLSDPPPFPMDAAFLGIGSALAVGVLAGALPATIAVRVKVIDAIRS
ncbi:ABC transporter permease [Okibacterium fritillariae]|uniref:Putative ABC transport system permease protein n=1 Tax=Okibacterium fritillariae TaxID=123320 RepID=A0A1T5KNC7_9MICO|nr:ABC transporter permease [Okibacterium fritillariae]SKC64778.1 putative ABC transport system permease protein [Okibacterium fritillariae]